MRSVTVPCRSTVDGAEKTIDLTHCGPELWSVLDEAATLSLVLLHAKGRHGELARPIDGLLFAVAGCPR